MQGSPSINLGGYIPLVHVNAQQMYFNLTPYTSQLMIVKAMNSVHISCSRTRGEYINSLSSMMISMYIGNICTAVVQTTQQHDV